MIASRFPKRGWAVALATALILPSTASVRAQAAAAPAATPVAITVVDAGSAPRRALRYTLAAGTRETVTMRQQVSMTMEMAGMAMPAQALPATLITTTAVVSDVSADGSASVAHEFVKIDVDPNGTDPAMLDAVRAQLSGMQGVTMRYTLSPTGRMSKPEFDASSPAAMQAVQSLASGDQQSVSFPTEAVGVGARWTVARSVTQTGLTVQQEVQYVVTSLAADSVVLEMSITQSAKDQVMDAAAMPPGASAKLRSLDGKGLSTMVVHFKRVQPSIDMKMDVKMALDIEVGGQSNAMSQSMVMEMKTVPAATPAP